MARRDGLIGFPDPVDEVSARLVATGALLLALATIISGAWWLSIPLAYGFLARVATGPKLSPLGLFVTRVLRPRLPLAEKLVSGPPKRFAQAIGAVLTTTAAVLALGFGQRTVPTVLLVLLVAAASLEAFIGFCLGCRIFAVLMRLGVIPAEVCERCNDLWGTSTASGTSR